MTRYKELAKEYGILSPAHAKAVLHTIPSKSPFPPEIQKFESGVNDDGSEFRRLYTIQNPDNIHWHFSYRVLCEFLRNKFFTNLFIMNKQEESSLRSSLDTFKEMLNDKDLKDAHDRVLESEKIKQKEEFIFDKSRFIGEVDE
jgi:hypothetical protein